MASTQQTRAIRRSLFPALFLGLILIGCAGSAPPDLDTTRFDGPQRLLVLPFENRTEGGSDVLGAEVTDLLVAHLRIYSLATLGPADLEAIYAEQGRPLPQRMDGPAMKEFAELTGCDGVVSGVITEYDAGRRFSKDRLAFNVRVIDPASGRRIYSTAFVSDAANLDATIRGIDQITLFGVREVTQRIARAR